MNSLVTDIQLKEGKDVMLWDNMRGYFSTKYCYDHFYSEVEVQRPWKINWPLKSLPKLVSFYGSVLTTLYLLLSLLKKRGIVTNDMCKGCNPGTEGVQIIVFRIVNLCVLLELC